MKKMQQGFSLVELVIVIVVVGLLAVAALPRFLDVTDEAKKASAAAVQVSPQAMQGSCLSVFPSNPTDPSWVDAAASGVALSLAGSGGASFLDFDSLGRATQCISAGCTVSISSSTHNEVRQVCINTEGYIYAC
ncbi:TPA: prepilin-type N-terminal cleavage/methylation domain-containing protein [Vibrio cholerae]|nr:prepilin-type N-terminal cleavage/methylation domain-containing protein [Vibrio cholerae]